MALLREGNHFAVSPQAIESTPPAGKRRNLSGHLIASYLPSYWEVFSKAFNPSSIVKTAPHFGHFTFVSLDT